MKFPIQPAGIHHRRASMKLDAFRREMESYRSAVDQGAMALKDSQDALDRLRQLYRRFHAEERSMADQVLAEWALAAQEGLRFDALALIDEFEVASAAPALTELASRLARSEEVGAPYELRKVNRIMRNLLGERS